MYDTLLWWGSTAHTHKSSMPCVGMEFMSCWMSVTGAYLAKSGDADSATVDCDLALITPTVIHTLSWPVTPTVSTGAGLVLPAHRWIESSWRYHISRVRYWTHATPGFLRGEDTVQSLQCWGLWFTTLSCRNNNNKRTIKYRRLTQT